jgi:hypothetical protein
MSLAILEMAREIMRKDGAAALNLHELARRVGLRTNSLDVETEQALAEGKLADLLESCLEMQQLWSGLVKEE